jgi:hypothetical protein
MQQIEIALFSSVSTGSMGTKSIPQIGQNQVHPELLWVSGIKGFFYTDLGALTKSIPHTGQSPLFHTLCHPRNGQ